MEKDNEKELVDILSESLNNFLANATEYLIPVSYEPKIVEIDKKYGCFNLTVENPVDGKAVSEILTKYKLAHNVDKVSATKFIDVYISNEANVHRYIKSESIYMIKHDNVKTIVLV